MHLVNLQFKWKSVPLLAFLQLVLWFLSLFQGFSFICHSVQNLLYFSNWQRRMVSAFECYYTLVRGAEGCFVFKRDV